MTDPDFDEQAQGFTWTETADEKPTSWSRMVLGTVGLGLAIGVLLAIGGFILLRFLG